MLSSCCCLGKPKNKVYPLSCTVSLDKSTGETNWQIFERGTPGSYTRSALRCYHQVLNDELIIFHSEDINNWGLSDIEARDVNGDTIRPGTDLGYGGGGYFWPIGSLGDRIVTKDTSGAGGPDGAASGIWSEGFNLADPVTGVSTRYEMGRLSNSFSVNSPLAITDDILSLMQGTDAPSNDQSSFVLITWETLAPSGTHNEHAFSSSSWVSARHLGALSSDVVVGANNLSAVPHLLRLSGSGLEWSVGIGNLPIYPGPKYDGSDVFYLGGTWMGSTHLGSVSAAGSLNWEVSASGYTSNLDVAGDCIILNPSSGGMEVRSKVDGSVLWGDSSAEFYGAIGDVIFTSGANSEMVARDAATGTALWSTIHVVERGSVTRIDPIEVTLWDDQVIISFGRRFHRPSTDLQGSGINAYVPGWDPARRFGYTP